MRTRDSSRPDAEARRILVHVGDPVSRRVNRRTAGPFLNRQAQVRASKPPSTIEGIPPGR